MFRFLHTPKGWGFHETDYMRQKIKRKCCCCDNIAKYHIKNGRTHYYCENCLPKNKINDAIYNENGFDICENEKSYFVKCDDVLKSIYETCWNIPYKHIVVVESLVEKLFEKNGKLDYFSLMSHKLFMSKIGNYFAKPNKYFDNRIPLYNDNFKRFYEDFKKDVNDKKIIAE